MIEQVSYAAAESSVLADAHAADQEAAAAAAFETAFPSTASPDSDESKLVAAQPQGKKIIYEGDLLAATAAGAITGAFCCRAK